MAFDRIDVDVRTVRRLVAAQFPAWADLPVEPVVPGGWDNKTFRLGTGMSVRMPTAAGYVAGVEKEHRWLPVLAPHLPAPIPAPIASGVPVEGYPFPWSVSRWLEGETATLDRLPDLPRFALDVAGFLTALRRIDARGGPEAGEHSFHRGAPPAHYDAATRRAIASLPDRRDAADATALWEEALASTWPGPSVWFHGDVAWGNLLVAGGRLSAVIDFGTSGVGDPACDTVLAWTLFSAESRLVFRDAMALDDATWARGRGWALWKALVSLDNVDPAKATEARRTFTELLAEHRQGG